MVSIVFQILHVEGFFWETMRDSLEWLHIRIIEKYRVLPKPNFGSFKRFLYVMEQKGNSLSYICSSRKKKKRNQADGLKLVIGSLTFFEHYACNLIVLERVAIVTSRRRMEKAHAFIRNQYFHPKVCVYHCLCCTSLFEVTRDGAPLKVVLWKASLGLQRMKLMGNWRFVVLSAINKSSRAFWKRTPQSGQRGTDGYVSPLLFSFRITL